jgi:hypothetical protein
MHLKVTADPPLHTSILETVMTQRSKLQYHQERAARHRELAAASELERVREAHLLIEACHAQAAHQEAQSRAGLI